MSTPSNASSRRMLGLLSALTWMLTLSSCRAFTQQSTGRMHLSHPHLPSIRTETPRFIQELKANKNDDDDPVNDKRPPQERPLIEDSRNFYEKEEKSSRKVISNLTAGNSLGVIVTTAGWLFVGIGFLLNLFGYDYVVKDGKVTIGTVEERQFQKEMNRVTKAKNVKPPSSSSLMEMQRGDVKLDE